MAIHYILRDNKVTTADPNDHTGVVVLSGSVGLDEVITRMAQLNPGISTPAMRAVLDNLGDAIQMLLLDGIGVRLPFGIWSLDIKNKFTDAADTFDPTRHRLRVTVEVGAKLEAGMKANALLMKDVAPVPGPLLTQFKNVADGHLNDTAKTGGIGEIRGENLKFDPTKPDEGIYFVPTTGAAVKVASVSQNLPKTLIFLIPTLTAQGYRLEVRNRQTVTGQLRIGSLLQTLTGVP